MYICRNIYIRPSFVVKNLFWPTLTEGPTQKCLKYKYDIYFPVVSLLLLYILRQYVPPLCSYYSEKEGSSGSSMFSFYVVLPFSRMLSIFSNKYFLPFCFFVIQQYGTKVQATICFYFMCLIFSRIFYQQIIFCVFLRFNRMACKHVLPFCVYVIQQNGTKIIQAAIFS